MSTFALTLSCVVIAIMVHQVVCAILFLRVMLRQNSDPIADEKLPKVAILMGVKGVDPDMPIGLQRLMQQNYPDYMLRIVIDSPDDPAWQAVRNAIQMTSATHVFAENYEADPQDGAVNSTNSKVLQSLRKLDDSFEVVAMADGDLVPHADWLRELVSPLVADESIGATFGNRWFVPIQGRLGSLVRQLWNMPAVVSMYLLEMPWGGCFAIRSDVIARCGFRKKWPKVVALDAATPGEFKRHQLRLQFVPSLMMANREECGLAFSTNFIQRQLLWTRLYHPNWPLAAGYGLVVTIVPVAALATAGYSLAYHQRAEAAMLVGAVAMYLLASWLLLPVTEWSVRRRIQDRHGLSRFTVGRWLRCAFAIPVTHAVQSVALLRALFARRVRWRGIVFEIRGRNEIRMIDQKPVAKKQQTGCGTRESL